jgi:hypothetical protein
MGGYTLPVSVPAGEYALYVGGSEVRDVIAEAGIFDRNTTVAVISDRIAAWGLSDDARLKKFARA